jgi:hypothetical protein
MRMTASARGVDTGSNTGLGSLNGSAAGSREIGRAVTSTDRDCVLARSATGLDLLTLRCGICSGPLRAAGLLRTGSTVGSRPLAPFHAGRCWTGASIGSSTGGGCLPQVGFFIVASRSRSPARICLVRSLSCGNCISRGPPS